MVIVKLHGGMANQMFPYAAARRLAHVLDTELKLDVTGFSAYHERRDLDFRKYALGVFDIQENFATGEEIEWLTTREKNALETIFCRKAGRPRSYVRERYYHFDPEIMELRGDVYLDGNWNSPRYFEDVAPLIRKEFSFRQPPAGKNVELLEMIEAVVAVSIHVRRGDYVSNPKVHTIYGCCGLDYYRRAIEFIAEKVPSSHFFAFSDDPEWVRANLCFDWPLTIVDCNGPLDAHEDLRLMSRCRHHIIANSGFSWWGAWLNPDPSKIVLAPRQWFQSQKYDAKDVVPTEWVRV